MPALFIDCIGPISAWLSVGAISTAAGLVAVTALTIGICSGAAKSAGPWTLIEYPSFFASACAPQPIVT